MTNRKSIKSWISFFIDFFLFSTTSLSDCSHVFPLEGIYVSSLPSNQLWPRVLIYFYFIYMCVYIYKIYYAYIYKMGNTQQCNIYNSAISICLYNKYIFMCSYNMYFLSKTCLRTVPGEGGTHGVWGGGGWSQGLSDVFGSLGLPGEPQCSSQGCRGFALPFICSLMCPRALRSPAESISSHFELFQSPPYAFLCAPEPCACLGGVPPSFLFSCLPCQSFPGAFWCASRSAVSLSMHSRALPLPRAPRAFCLPLSSPDLVLVFLLLHPKSSASVLLSP